MNKTIKQIAVVIAVGITLFITSCMPETEVADERTLALEISEISQVIAQIEDAGINVDTTELGVYYIIDTMGVGPFPNFGDTLSMRYTGYFLDGYVFDASDLHQENINGIWEFVYQPDRLIKGFENGISLMNKGTILNMIIPSRLAYGEGGTASILPYSPLRFEAQMVNIRPAN